MNPFLEEAYQRPLPSKTDDFREKLISDIITKIEDPEFVKAHSICKGKDFTRNRKLSFLNLIVFLAQGLVRSLQRELNSYFQKTRGTEFTIQVVSKSALSHAREKLKPEAFTELNKVANVSFYKNADYLKWRGFRLLAIDGSTLCLPNHPTVEEEFGTTGFGRYADSDRSLAKVSMLFDVLNNTTIDAQINGYRTSEIKQAVQHLESVTPGKDLIIFDRGYMNRGLMFEMIQKGIHFCIRLNEWMTRIKDMKKIGLTDVITHFYLTENHQHLLDKYNTRDSRFECRIVAVPLPDGNTEFLCTSVLDSEIIPYGEFVKLYHMRWNIEESYKLCKSRMQMEAFSGKTAHAIKQDFFAKVFMMTTVAIMTFPVDEKVKKEQQENKKRKHIYKANRTNVASFLRDNLCRFLIKKIVRPALEAFDSFIRETLEIVRPGRSFVRRHIKKKPPAMCYKQL